MCVFCSDTNKNFFISLLFDIKISISSNPSRAPLNKSRLRAVLGVLVNDGLHGVKIGPWVLNLLVEYTHNNGQCSFVHYQKVLVNVEKNPWDGDGYGW